MKATAWVDGGNRGSPGPYACAAVLAIDDGPTIEKASYLGDYGTNNKAEYEGVLLALRVAKESGVTHLRIRCDSKLIVEQVLGAWKTKEPTLWALKERARELAAGFERIDIKHVPREENVAADALVTRLLDERVGKKRRP